jgi:hypothetical protein
MRAVIWGLRGSNNTYRYVHAGFHNAFLRAGWESLWVDDAQSNAHVIRPGSLVLALGSQSRYLPTVSGAKYVLHNFDSTSGFEKPLHHLNLQVYTTKAKGQRVGKALAFYDPKSKTLSQPWGLPDINAPYLAPNPHPSNVEFWIGSIWNNALGQGNQKEIKEYKAALKSAGISFVHAGSQTRSRFLSSVPILRPLADWFGRTSELGEQESQVKVNESPVGAVIVGSWQREVGYLPCRLFKNLAAGQPIFSNSNFSPAFGEFQVHSSDIEQLVEWRLSISHSRAKVLVSGAQTYLDEYSYTAAVNRILEVL